MFDVNFSLNLVHRRDVINAPFLINSSREFSAYQPQWEDDGGLKKLRRAQFSIKFKNYLLKVISSWHDDAFISRGVFREEEE